MADVFVPKILALATESSAYAGADAVGKAHQEYPANVYVFRAPSPVLFPMDFYLRCYAKGIDGILVTAAGSDCPFRGAYDRLAKRIDTLTGIMKDGGLETKRLRLTAICTVCIKAFLKEVNQLHAAVCECGPVNREVAARLLEESLQRLRGAEAASA